MRQPGAGGGWPAIFYALRKARSAGGLLRMYRALRSGNACKTCALGMGGQRGGMTNELGRYPEVCKKSIQAMAADMQGRIRAHFFDDFSLQQLAGFSSRELEAAGRLTEPLVAGPLDSHYRPIAWEEALQRIAARLARTQPAESFFYASGRSSNEAGFLYQLLARAWGTNNVNNCSYYCHQASGVALSSVIGTGTATAVLEDLDRCDLLVLIGANPASNHPRLMKTIVDLRRRGGKVIVINPLREVGLVRFKVPSDPRSLLLGSTIADLYVQPHVSGDVALLSAIARAVIERGAADQAYLREHTAGFDAFAAALNYLTWDSLIEQSGVDRSVIEQVAALYAASSGTIFCWAMGVTHHEHGVANVQAIAHLALLRGMVGRPGCGLLPLRGHSNVQGMGSMGVVPALKPATAARLQEHFGFPLPGAEGLDTLSCLERAAHSGMRLACCMGGNLYGASPDAAFAARALSSIDLVVYLSTTLNTGHARGRGRETIILPVLPRDEEPQATTQESMFSYVRLSAGGPARHDGPRSEVQVIVELAERLPAGRTPIDWAALRDHRRVRAAIAAVVPGYQEIGAIDQTRREFHVAGRSLHEPTFPTSDGRARFHSVDVPALPGGADELRLMTVRSEGQFNTVVYEEHDIYRGQERRDVIMMHPRDIARLGLAEGQRATVRSAAGTLVVLVKPADIRPGNAAMYFPEANVLVPARADPRSRTPGFKCTPITVQPAAADEEEPAWRHHDIPLTVTAPGGRRTCAEAMASAMEKEPGVRSAVLDARGGSLRLTYDPRRVSLARVQRLARQLGLELDRSFESCTLRVHGMRCADCAEHVAGRLRKLPGITRVSINPAAEVIGIEHDVAAPDLPAVEQRLARAGYDVHPPPASRASFRAAEARQVSIRGRMSLLTALCLAGLLGGLALQAAGAPHDAMLIWWLASYVAGGWYSTARVVRGLRSGSINVDLLMVVAALGAAAIGEWPEGLTLLFLFALSTTLEAFVLGRTRRAIEALMDLAPDEAVVRRGTEEVRVPAEELVVGDVIIVRPGERIAADGVVRAGSTAVDQSPVTGESMPVDRGPGDAVFAATLNRHGAVEIEVTRRAADATLARMVRLVEEAQAERARSQRFTDWFGQRYTIGVLAAAAITAIIPLLFLGEPFAKAFYRAMTVLVVASPCAVVISIPSAILSAVTSAARGGVLFKGGAHLERAASVRAMAFDKTGTLTIGRPRVVEVVAAEGWSDDGVLAVAASAESLSEHPLARAVVEGARARGLALETAAEVQAIIGRGVEALVAGRRVLVGKAQLLSEQAIDIPATLDEAAARLRAAGRTVVFVADGPRAAGVVAIADTLRPGAAEAMERLRALGITALVMLTGDNEEVARNIAGTLGIEFQAQLMPDEKLQVIRSLRQKHGSVAMVGDGINDAPSLAAADLGISMGGSATDVAMETADVVLMADELRHVPWAIALARAARRVILQNLIFAFGVMAVLLAFTFMEHLPLPLAVAGHEGSTVLVILNGLRLLAFRREPGDARPRPPAER